MKAYTPLVLILMMTACLSGCTGDPDFGANISVTGVVADSDADFCGDEDEGTHCDTLTVSIEVTGESDFSTNMFYWEAVADDGSITSAPWVNGPDACAAGFTFVVTLDFDVADGAQLVELRWNNIFDEVDCEISGVY